MEEQPAINATMSSCLNGPGPDRGDEGDTMENKGRVGVIMGERERLGVDDRRSSVTQNQSSVGFRANKPSSVYRGIAAQLVN